MTNTQHKATLTLLIILAVGIVGFIVYSIVSNSSSDTILRDKDTGESIDLSPEAQVGTGGSAEAPSKVVLFGLSDTIKKVRESSDETTGDFISAVREGIWGYSRSRTNDTFPTITILPNDLKVDGNVVTSKIRLGQDNAKFASLKIEMNNGRKSAIITIDERSQLGEYKGKYIYVGGLNSESPLFEIGQKNDTSPDLVIDAVEGNREGALNHLVSAGYNVPDFTIEFTNYERPTL